MTPFLASLLEISLNNVNIPSDWKKAIVVPVYKGGERSTDMNYRPITLTSVVCKQLEHVIARYLRQVWDKNDWLYEGQHGFRPVYSCESQVNTVCQDIVDSLDEDVGRDAIIIDISKAIDLVPHDRLLTKLSASGVDKRVVVWVQEFLVDSTQRVRVGGQISKEVKVTSGVPQGSVLSPLLFLVYVTDIWRNIASNIRRFAGVCIVYTKITNKNDAESCRMVWKPWGEWAVENEMKINPGKSRAIRFTRAWVKNPLGYSFGDQKNSGSQQL